MNDRFIATLALCRRAGKLCYGLDTVKYEIFGGRVKLVIAASDVSENTAEDIRRTCCEHDVKLIESGYKMNDFIAVVGKPSGVFGITDKGLAGSVIRNLGGTQ